MRICFHLYLCILSNILSPIYHTLSCSVFKFIFLYSPLLIIYIRHDLMKALECSYILSYVCIYVSVSHATCDALLLGDYTMSAWGPVPGRGWIAYFRFTRETMPPLKSPLTVRSSRTDRPNFQRYTLSVARCIFSVTFAFRIRWFVSHSLSAYIALGSGINISKPFTGCLPT